MTLVVDESAPIPTAALISPVNWWGLSIVVEAFERFRGRPARLNMGDCFAYAHNSEPRP